ncbi:hypothetical protein SAMN05421858_4784 [Haladaptatus litoreus]|uniref:Uncharacterized protein n=1 Tax=Haladaptatus litoreus TaxID=553468 RepID=A0A1N7F7L8_9EURY|nr:hypothetical protein SAMN05421858_4784 [Haladaptatus litoreus]
MLGGDVCCVLLCLVEEGCRCLGVLLVTTVRNYISRKKTVRDIGLTTAEIPEVALVTL